jgi:hypothetical protein
VSDTAICPPILILTINRFNEINASSSSDREKTKLAIYLPLRFSAGKEQNSNHYKFSDQPFPENSKNCQVQQCRQSPGPSVDSGLHCCKKPRFDKWFSLRRPPSNPIQTKRSQNDGAQSEDEARELMDIIVTPAAYCLFYEQLVHFS